MVVYGHNFPAIENYIYTFHMPLFFFLGGFFHPKKLDFHSLKRRAFQLLLPYFIWSFLLYLFWFFIGRKYGDSLNFVNDPLKNFLGVFFAQGDYEYMSWGIPMWFLPAIFLTFFTFGLIRKIKNFILQLIILILLIFIGFLIPKLFDVFLIWSLDVVFVSLYFYSLSFYFKEYLLKEMRLNNLIIFFLVLIHLALAFFYNFKIDMYRSLYGNEFLFLIISTIAIFTWYFLFKYFINLKILSFFGKNTILVLAMHSRSLTIIKFILLISLGFTSFSFNEIQKLLIVFIQLAIMYFPIIFINKYLPILNGK